MAVIGLVAMVASGCGTLAHVSHPKPTVNSWVPELRDVIRADLTLNVGSDSDAFQSQDPLEIDPATATGRAVVSKLVGWLQEARSVARSPIPVPVFGEHALTLFLKGGKRITILPYYTSSRSGFHISPIDVAIGAQRYKDPALATWLNARWRADADRLDAGWTCADASPPQGHMNEISGAFDHGRRWVVAGDSGAGCAVLYTGGNSQWRSSLVAMHVLSGHVAHVEQVQFPDAMHGFVLMVGSPGAGMPPRSVLYATKDGGTTWSIVPADSHQPFPQGAAPVSMRFTSPADGWLVTLDRSYDPARVYVYHTADGGETWTDTYASLPASAMSSDFQLATAPVFQSELDGTIQVLSQWGGILFFTTADGGQHWTFNPGGNG